jgi:hypothetical protein
VKAFRDIGVFLLASLVLGFALGVLAGVTERHFRYVVVALVLALGYLLWQILSWLKAIAATLGCVPKRTKRIEQLLKKQWAGIEDPQKRLTAAEDEELKNLCEA